MSHRDKIESDIRIMSVQHANDKARVRKKINAVLQYDLALAMEMAMGDTWDIEPSRMLKVLRDIEKHLQNVTA